MTTTESSPATAGSHPRHQLVDDFTHPVRFSMMAVLAGVNKLDFASVRDHLQVSDSVLSRQASHLEKLDAIKVQKGYVGKRPRTWFSLTKQGRQMWTGHIAALQAIAASAPPPVPEDDE